MSRARLFLVGIVAITGILLAGCAANGARLRPGVSDEAAVRADMGAPAETVALPNGGQAWFYPFGPLGRSTVRVELGPDGKVRNVQQPLDEYNFDRIVAGKTTREELRAMLGSPFYVWHVRGNQTLWEYRYFWGLDDPWKLYVSMGPDGIVTGQARQPERDGGPVQMP